MNTGLQITITGRSMTVRNDLKEYVESKAARLERYNDQLQSIEVVLSEQGDRRIAEMIAHSKGGKVVGKAEHEDAFAAVDLLVDKMYQQLHKQKEKAQDKRKRSERVPPPAPSLDAEERLESYEEVVDKFGEKFDEK